MYLYTYVCVCVIWTYTKLSITHTLPNMCNLSDLDNMSLINEGDTSPDSTPTPKAGLQS